MNNIESGVIPNKWYQSLAACHNSCLLHFSLGILLASPLLDCLLHQSASRMHCMRYTSIFLRLFSAKKFELAIPNPNSLNNL